MSNQNYRGEWAGCSNLKERIDELNKAHEEFINLLKSGFKLKDVKTKRPRIKKNQACGFKVIITCFGPLKITIEEYNQYCKDFKTI